MFQRLILALLVFGLLSAQLQAQIPQGGQPHQWHDKTVKPVGSTQVVPPNQVSVDALGNKLLQRGNSFDWGIPRSVHVDFMAKADISAIPGATLRRHAIRSKGAAMISVQFDVFDLVPGAKFFLYDKLKGRYIGSLTDASELPNGKMATAVLPGEEVVLELIEPHGLKGSSQIVIGSIVHGVRDIFDFGAQIGTKDYYPGFDAAPCHNNVVCPIANGWENQASSVAMFLNQQGWGCSGVMVNNTAQDGRPLFHIANHCYTPDVGTWTFYWNYDSPTCVGNSGPTTQTQVGASLLANDYYDDFALLELFQSPPASWDIYYSGWDVSGAQPSNQTVIQHPLYDVKKIAFDNDPASSYTDQIGINMWGCTWESGIVEFVSSGSPLFDQNKRMIGHMTEGNNTCSNVSNEVTGCAKMSDSWTGTNASTRLKDHLDPLNTGNLVLSGFNPAIPAFVEIPVKAFLQGPFDPNAGLMKDDLRNLGMLPVQEPYTALGFTFVGGGGEQTTSSVLGVTGNAAIVDWVLVELRDASDNENVIASKAALIRRDGRIRNADGTELSMTVAPGDYYIAVRHRNHFGVLTSSPVALSASTSLIDLSDGSTDTFLGNASAMVNVSGVWLFWSGDTNNDGVIKYTGADNDRDAILLALGGGIPTNVVSGYSPDDVNMDGVIKYTGQDNDRDIILLNIGGNIPTSTRTESLP